MSKWSEWNPSSALTGSEVIPLLQGGANKRTTAAALAALAGPSPGTPPTIVQTAISNAISPSITLGAAPTAGNLLVAICQAGAVTPGSGWTAVASNPSGTFYGLIATKVAGAGESTTQTPIATAGAGPVIMMWEIAGAAAAPVVVAESAIRTAATNASSTVVPSVTNSLLLVGMALETPSVAITAHFNFTEDRNLASGMGASMGHADASKAVYGCIWQFAANAATRPQFIVITA